MNCNILIVGVGGQGTLLASRILGAYASICNLDCKLSEVHGMSQRGGSVVTHVRIADEVFSPMIAEGEADVIIAFEKLEGYRWRHFLRKDGILIINDQEIMPMPVIIGTSKYPADIYDNFKKENVKIIVLDALKLAKEAGNAKAVNTVMIGALTRILDFNFSKAQESLAISVPTKLLDVNKKALELGYNSQI